jgi:hypothetical protein
MAPTALTFESKIASMTVAGGLITKVTRDPFQDRASAETLCKELDGYHADLAAGPLAVAGLLDIAVVESSKGYHVKHTMEFLDGPSLGDLPEDERRIAAGALADTVMQMPTYKDGRVVTPPDLKKRNVFMCGSTAVLVDTCPPWMWGDDDYVRTALKPDMSLQARVCNTEMVGRRAGVLSDVMLAAVPDIRPGETAKAHIARAIATAPSWYGDLVPAGLPEASRDLLDTLVTLKLGSRLGRCAVDA